jgi:hypothetical protein
MLKLKIKASTNNEQKNIDLKQQHYIYVRNAESARSLQENQERASRNPDEYFAFGFNLEKQLPYPKLSVCNAY